MSSDRLKLLKPLLNKYKRRFHVLDIGGGVEPSQNIGQEITRHYDAVATVFEKDWRVENQRHSPRTMVLKHRLTPVELDVLRSCEHFDVVLMLNVLHWYEESWQFVLERAVRMADWIVVQVPSRGDSNGMMPGRQYVPAMHEWLESYPVKKELLGETIQFAGHPARPLWLLKGQEYGKRILTRTHVNSEVGWCDTSVSSDFTQLWGYMNAKRQWVKPWVVGMNLYNFCRLGGVYPNADWVEERMREAVGEWREVNGGEHGDVNVHNFVFDGEVCKLIDGGELIEGHLSDEAALEEAVKVMREMVEGKHVGA